MAKVKSDFNTLLDVISLMGNLLANANLTNKNNNGNKDNMDQI